MDDKWWLTIGTETWMLLSRFEDACRYFDDVREAGYFMVKLNTGATHICTRAGLEQFRQFEDAAFRPIEHRKTTI